MTTECRITWVALPAGVDPAGRLRVSIFVSPRLHSDDGVHLRAYPPLLDWPATLNTASLTLQVNGTTVPAQVASVAESDLWQALFPASTAVHSFRFDDYADRPFVSYSVRPVAARIRRLYAEAAAAFPDHLPRPVTRHDEEGPSLAHLIGDIADVHHGDLGEGVDSPEARAARVATLLGDARRRARAQRAPGAIRGLPRPIEPLSRPPDSRTARHFERALLFHSRAEREPKRMPEGGQQWIEAIDLHQMFSALGDHPWLMRRLGLVVDLLIDPDQIPETAADDEATLSVRSGLTDRPHPGLDVSSVVEVSPRTAYVHRLLEDRPRVFATRVRQAPAGSLPSGLMVLPRDDYSVESLDVDGAALKTINLAASLAAATQLPEPERSAAQPETTGLPGLRTGGLGLVRRARADEMQQLFAATLPINDAIESGSPMVLYAEDVIRGYRLDIQDSMNRQWRSLHQRRVTATAERARNLTGEVRDEGFAQLSLAGSATEPEAEPDPDSELYVHETMVTWDAWSLAAPRPGKALSRDTRAPTPEDLETQPARVPNSPWTTMGLSLETRTEPGTLPRLRFGRTYRMRLRLVDLAGNGPTLQEADTWLNTTGTTSLSVPFEPAPYLRCEPVPAPALVPRMAYGEGASLTRLVIRSNGSGPSHYASGFNDSELVVGGEHPGYRATDERHVASPKAAFEMVERHGGFDDVIGGEREATALHQRTPKSAYTDAVTEAGTLPETYDQDRLTLPYLADPMAVGAVFFDLPGQPEGAPFTVHYSWDGRHNPLPFRMVLAAGSGPPQWDADQGVLTVQLPPATAVSARVASLVEDPHLFAIPWWCQESLGGAELDRVMAAVEANRCWLISPWHDLEFVHAVQQPQQAPKILDLRIERGGGETSADMRLEADIDAASTEKIDVLAQWKDTVDDGTGPKPRTVVERQHVLHLPLALARTSGPDADPHESPYGLLHEHHVWLDTTPREGEPTLGRHEFGDTRYRQVTYTVAATSAFAEVFPRAWHEHPDTFSRTSSPLVLDVPSSAPPASPLIHYVVPTQGWEVESAAQATTRRRVGGGLRVYLHRPWFSSGAGELLGVVLSDDHVHEADPLARLVTLLGRDPVRGGALPPAPRATAFVDPAHVLKDQRLMEGGHHCTIIGYEPVYDEQGRLYCDINIDTEQAYFPFVRLALVRLQTHALPGCAISKVAVADICQTMPDRTLTITSSSTEEGRALHLTLTGPTYPSVRGPKHTWPFPVYFQPLTIPGPGKVTAQIEGRHGHWGDETLGWVPEPGTRIELEAHEEGSEAIWTGYVVVPDDDEQPTDYARRLLVVEHDEFVTDQHVTAGRTLSRVVYADAIPLLPSVDRSRVSEPRREN